MNIKDFTENSKVLAILNDLKNDNIKNKTFSDIIDNNNNQYVDLVMEGGGVLGIALVGYIYVLEQMNIRFLQLGGSSAGAINTLVMAAAGKIDEPKAEWIADVLANKNLADFVDGDDDVKDLIDSLLNGSKKFKSIWKAAQVIDNITEDLGLNPGNNFHQWLTTVINSKGIKTLADLDKLRSEMPVGLKNRITNKPCDIDAFKRIAIVAADVTTETKTIFPEMCSLYWKTPETVNPADFVRASMSVPFFFTPFKIKDIPKGPERWKKWNDTTGYAGDIPSEISFVDGGIMSNFPINLFHDYKNAPSAPTFGAKLGYDRNEPNDISGIGKLTGAIFNSARHVHDYDFILRNPDYKKLVCYISTGNHNWLNFNLKDADKVDLFNRGAEAAAAFLRTFDWAAYKELRNKININKI